MAEAKVIPIFSFAKTADVLNLVKKLMACYFLEDQWNLVLKLCTRNSNAILKYAK